MHAGERVKRHPGFLQQFRGGHDLIEGRRTAFGQSEPVVQFARAVDAQAHQETVFLEKPGPLFVQQHPVGLQIVLDALAGLRVLFLERHHLAEKVQPP